MTAARATKGKRGGGKVWHVFRFRERFELADDQRFCRKGPLIYARDYVSAADDESAAYLQQLQALGRHRNALELEGAWVRLRRAASGRSRAYRGYLLTPDNRPASDAEIGRTVLFCDARRASRILNTLAEVGLLEQVCCPIFDLSENEAPKKKRSKKAAETSETPKQAKKKTGRRKSVSREGSGAHEALSILRAQKRNGMANSKEREQKLADNGNGKGQAPIEREKPVPLKSHEVTLEGVTAPRAHAPQRVPGAPDIVKLADALPRAVDGLAHGFSVRAGEFAREIFELLRCPFAPDSVQGARELGCFRAGLLDAIDAGLSPPQLDEVISKAKRDAARIGKSRKRYYRNQGTPEAYWRFLWNKHVDARRGHRATGSG